jgi:hypothetical protein
VLVTRSAEAIRSFVLSLDLPEATAGVSRGSRARFTGEREVVAVGAQLTEFSDTVATELRPLISNSMLLAQLAANKATAQATNVFEWHLKYRDVLNNIGWQIRDTEEQVQEVSNKNLGVHKAIIPLLTAMLGPAVSAASMVVSVLQGLNDMDAESPWITLFDRQSQHAHGAKFQISYVDADSQGEPTINLLGCAIQAERTITQVLFFKFSSQTAELRKNTSVLSTTSTRLTADKDVIASRVQTFISDFVKNVEI